MSNELFDDSRNRYSIVVHGLSHAIDPDDISHTACGRQIDADGDWEVDGEHYSLCTDCIDAEFDREDHRRLNAVLDAATAWAALDTPLTAENLRAKLADYWAWTALDCDCEDDG